MSPTDDELMIRLQSGDPRAFPLLTERYQGMLIGFFIRNTDDVHLSEDLTQDTLLRLYQQYWNYLPQGGFRGWLFTMARNLLIDSVRRRKNDALVRAIRRNSEDEQAGIARIVADLLPVDQGLLEQDLSQLVDALLQELPVEQRETFTLHVYSEFPLPEVAQLTGVPLATAKSRLRLAREKLAVKLQLRGWHPKEPEESAVV